MVTAVSVFQIDAYNPIEDRYHVNIRRKWYGIFDGHGSYICSEYVHRRLPEKLVELLEGEHKPIEEALPLAFKIVDEEFLNKYSHLRGMAIGTCVLFTILDQDTLYIANVGDSVAIVARRNKDGVFEAIPINNEHNTQNEEEIALLKLRTTDPFPIRGAPNSNTPGSRVGGVMSVTRALGDGVFKKLHMSLPFFEKHLPYLTCEPEITKYKISLQDEFILLASDGLFEQVPREEVLKWIQEYIAEHKTSKADLEKTSEMVVGKIFDVLAGLMNTTVDELKAMPNKKRMFDDTTVIIIFLEHEYVDQPE